MPDEIETFVPIASRQEPSLQELNAWLEDNFTRVKESLDAIIAINASQQTTIENQQAEIDALEGRDWFLGRFEISGGVITAADEGWNDGDFSSLRFEVYDLKCATHGDFVNGRFVTPGGAVLSGANYSGGFWVGVHSGAGSGWTQKAGQTFMQLTSSIYQTTANLGPEITIEFGRLHSSHIKFIDFISKGTNTSSISVDIRGSYQHNDTDNVQPIGLQLFGNASNLIEGYCNVFGRRVQ